MQLFGIALQLPKKLRNVLRQQAKYNKSLSLLTLPVFSTSLEHTHPPRFLRPFLKCLHSPHFLKQILQHFETPHSLQQIPKLSDTLPAFSDILEQLPFPHCCKLVPHQLRAPTFSDSLSCTTHLALTKAGFRSRPQLLKELVVPCWTPDCVRPGLLTGEGRNERREEEVEEEAKSTELNVITVKKDLRKNRG